mmetsp:Transcript_133179/g.414094  ORF Transcript_133179/g.414094 Transcript_133179/m.414094 type:complete len:117 (+) Transcript_133179:315-665(+)
MMEECLGPFLPDLGRAAELPAPGGGAGSLGFDLLGVDVLVDADFRPWLLEVNLLPSLSPVEGDSEATAHREAVVEDVLAGVLDASRDAGCLWAAGTPAGAWEPLAAWEDEETAGHA